MLLVRIQWTCHTLPVADCLFDMGTNFSDTLFLSLSQRALCAIFRASVYPGILQHFL